MSKVMSLGSGGGIGIDGVMQPARAASTGIATKRCMTPSTSSSKARSKRRYRIFGYLQAEGANAVGGASSVVWVYGDYGVRLTVVGSMIEMPAPKNRCCRNRLSSPSLGLFPTNSSAL